MEVFNDFPANAFELFVAEGTTRMLNLYPGIPLENVRETLVYQWNQMDIYQRAPWIKRSDENREIYSKTFIAEAEQENSEYDSDCNSEDINELIESSDGEETSEESIISFPDFVHSSVDYKQSPVKSSQNVFVQSRPVLAPIPSWPRPPAPAFLHFSEYMRPRITAENPFHNYGSITKLIRERWESMTIEERAPWGHLAQQDEIRFENEKLAYIAEQEQFDNQSYNSYNNNQFSNFENVFDFRSIKVEAPIVDPVLLNMDQSIHKASFPNSNKENGFKQEIVIKQESAVKQENVVKQEDIIKQENFIKQESNSRTSFGFRNIPTETQFWVQSNDKENIPIEYYENNYRRSPLQPLNFNQIHSTYNEIANVPSKTYKPDDRRYGLKVPILYKSAYEIFYTEVKADCMNKYPSLITESHLNKCIDDKWKTMDTDERKPWEEKAELDKFRWESERKEYLSDQLRRFVESQRGVLLNDWVKNNTH
ncbi:14718_t:CDS:1 [Dentiscutata erythropus]|uniref:14718_t:CDS:1 n=1 Tax=Dentiscutata erythropus TaxID=1348616 RepID=A0A9N9G566_9GLOM|nr:14718_t:CDS:1 [Dentiscutata erythropus]